MAKAKDDTLMWVLLGGGAAVGLYLLLKPKEASSSVAPATAQARSAVSPAETVQPMPSGAIPTPAPARAPESFAFIELDSRLGELKDEFAFSGNTSDEFTDQVNRLHEDAIWYRESGDLTREEAASIIPKITDFIFQIASVIRQGE